MPADEAGMIDLEYIEVGGLLYPDIDTGFERLSALDKYGKGRLAYQYPPILPDATF